jgi:hypothetical protein
LINELVLAISGEQSAYIDKQLTPDQSVRDAFLTIWRGSIRWFLDHPDAYRYQQRMRESALIEDSVIEETARNFAYYYVTIRRGIEAGLIKPYPIDLLGGVLYHSIVAAMDQILVVSDPDRRDQLIVWSFDIFWDGIKLTEARSPTD